MTGFKIYEEVAMFEINAAGAIFLFVEFAMSLGIIFGNRPLKGSCGGLNNLKNWSELVRAKDERTQVGVSDKKAKCVPKAKFYRLSRMSSTQLGQ